MINASTVAQARALWGELIPMYEEKLRECHLGLENAVDWPQVTALQAKAKAIRAFLKVPQDLENLLELERQMAAQEKK